MIQHLVSVALLLGTTVVAGVMLDDRYAAPVDREMWFDEHEMSVDRQEEEAPPPAVGLTLREAVLERLDPQWRYSGPGCPDDWTWEHDADDERFREALWQGYAYAEAECIAHTPAPIRIEHVHRPPTSAVVSRRSIRLVADWRQPDRKPITRLEPFQTHGWILDADAAPLVHALDHVTIEIRACNDDELHAHPGLIDEVAVHFTIDARGRVENLALLAPNDHELRAMRAHVANAGILVRSAEGRTCTAAALRRTTFALPAGAEHVDATLELVSIQPPA